MLRSQLSLKTNLYAGTFIERKSERKAHDETICSCSPQYFSCQYKHLPALERLFVLDLPRNPFCTCPLRFEWYLHAAGHSFQHVFRNNCRQTQEKRVIAGASAVTMALLLMASAVFFLSDTTHLSDMSSPVFWLFSLPLLLSALTGNLRSITLSTLVSILVPKQDYGRANGLVGTVQGFGMIANTVLSGLIIGYLGMSWAIMITLFLSAVTLVHLFSLPFPKNVLYTTRTCKTDKSISGEPSGRSA